jgi:hypothetical protein
MNTTKTNNSVQTLRTLIREEVERSIQKTLLPAILEVVKTMSQTSSLTEGVRKPTAPLRQRDTKATAADDNLDGLNNELAQTLRSYGASLQNQIKSDMPATRSTPNLVESYQPAATGDAADVMTMLRTASSATKEEAVVIHDVPDFSALVSKMGI